MSESQYNRAAKEPALVNFCILDYFLTYLINNTIENLIVDLNDDNRSNLEKKLDDQVKRVSQ